MGKTPVKRLRVWEAVQNSGVPKMGDKTEGLQYCSWQGIGKLVSESGVRSRLVLMGKCSRA